MRHKGLIAYAIVFAFFIYCAIYFQGDLQQINFMAIAHAWEIILLVALLSLLNYLVRIIRWFFYLRCLGFSLPFGFTALTYLAGFAFTLSPGKIGEMVRAQYYHRLDIPLSITSAAFFVERLLDLLVMLILSLFFVASSPTHHALIGGVTLCLVGVFVFLMVSPWGVMMGWTERNNWLPSALKKLALGLISTLLSARTLLRPALLTMGLSAGIIAWTAEGIGLMVASSTLQVGALAWDEAVGIYAVAMIIGALSFLPGGLGSTEMVMVILLNRWGYLMREAMLLTLICRLLTLWLAVVIGWLAVLVLRYHSLLKEVVND